MADVDPEESATRPADRRDLRRGWTTGACATAAARAAYQALLTGVFPNPVAIALSRGERPSFALARGELGAGWARAAILKDAGDDPDITHGALIVVDVAHGEEGGGVAFKAGEGVGTVTLPGLSLAPGEPAINPAPRAMIRQTIGEIAGAFGGSGDVLVTITIPGGAELAKKTMNARLGIVGGLSILGTTGVVIPYSCSSWIHAIQRGIDVARAAGQAHIAACTGSASEAAVQRRYGLPEVALIDMGDFAGGLLKYLRSHPVPRLTIAGGFGKLSKLAAGHLDLHSGRSSVDTVALTSLLREIGAPDEVLRSVDGATTAGQIMAAAGAWGPILAEHVARRARETALAALAGGVAVDVAVFDRGGVLLGHAGP
ncbi:MAG: cobalt-precorrin-5B (C(1))-methyltransferase [Rhodospirillaceae bacterium]|nr:cobalt-precorrin-5B (C(1))-methyltransferase [Rhodospirillaceae bacterium]